MGSGSEAIRKRYGSGDPDLHQNVMDPQHWLLLGAYVTGSVESMRIRIQIQCSRFFYLDFWVRKLL
jgi:hypothetical protein